MHAGYQLTKHESCRVCAEIKGIPPYRAFATLPDKRHVLTEDAEGAVTLWDVTSGARIQEYGKVDTGTGAQYSIIAPPVEHV